MNYLELQIATTVTELPTEQQFQLWLDTVLAGQITDTEVVIRLVDNEESAELNLQYRHKPGPTNILSFPFEAPEGMELDLLGDLLICAPLIASEAEAQHKTVLHHWAHITIHGVLHLLGYDHIDEQDAEQMEALEIEFLSKLNIANPYLEENAQ
jgi:probable rRNA maturation factor